MVDKPNEPNTNRFFINLPRMHVEVQSINDISIETQIEFIEKLQK